MRGYLLQDWTTVRGDSGTVGPLVSAIAQGAASWLDIGDYEDLVFTLDVRESVNTALKLVYDTSPIKSETSFVAMLPAFALAAGQRVDRVYTSMAAVPPARFVRWRMVCQNPSGAYDATFRIWIAAYAWGTS